MMRFRLPQILQFRGALIRGLMALLLIASVAPVRVQAEPVHEFLMSCTYGALAGTVIGAASLAFSQNPGQDLNAVARGASLGLYAGIILGIYVVYGVPSQKTTSNQSSLNFWLQPMFSSGLKLTGAQLQWQVAHF